MDVYDAKTARELANAWAGKPGARVYLSEAAVSQGRCAQLAACSRHTGSVIYDRHMRAARILHDAAAREA